MDNELDNLGIATQQPQMMSSQLHDEDDLFIWSSRCLKKSWQKVRQGSMLAVLDS